MSFPVVTQSTDWQLLHITTNYDNLSMHYYKKSSFIQFLGYADLFALRIFECIPRETWYYSFKGILWISDFPKEHFSAVNTKCHAVHIA